MSAAHWIVVVVALAAMFSTPMPISAYDCGPAGGCCVCVNNNGYGECEGNHRAGYTVCSGTSGGCWVGDDCLIWEGFLRVPDGTVRFAEDGDAWEWWGGSGRFFQVEVTSEGSVSRARCNGIVVARSYSVGYMMQLRASSARLVV